MTEIMTAINDFISNTGFPIACVLVMFYMLYKEQGTHRDEMNEVTKAINNNTIVLERLVERLEARDEGD